MEQPLSATDLAGGWHHAPTRMPTRQPTLIVTLGHNMPRLSRPTTQDAHPYLQHRHVGRQLLLLPASRLQRAPQLLLHSIRLGKLPLQLHDPRLAPLQRSLRGSRGHCGEMRRGAHLGKLSLQLHEPRCKAMPGMPCASRRIVHAARQQGHTLPGSVQCAAGRAAGCNKV